MSPRARTKPRSPATTREFHLGKPAPNKGRTFPAEVPTEEEVSRLIQASSSTSATGTRNAAIVAVLFRTGVRISEMLKLHVKDVDRKARTVVVLRGKGRKRRELGIDSQTLTLVERWLDARAARGLGKRGPLFCTLEGRSLWAPYIRIMLDRLAERAGITKKIRPHGLRHGHAVLLVQNGCTVPDISQALGHSSSAVTAKYIDHICPKERIERVRAAMEWTL